MVWFVHNQVTDTTYLSLSVFVGRAAEDDSVCLLAPNVGEQLGGFDGKLKAWLEEAVGVVQMWLDQATAAGHRMAACKFHAHRALAAAPCGVVCGGVSSVEAGAGEQEFGHTATERLVTSVAYLKTWHVSGGAPAGAGEEGGGPGRAMQG